MGNIQQIGRTIPWNNTVRAACWAGFGFGTSWHSQSAVATKSPSPRFIPQTTLLSVPRVSPSDGRGTQTTSTRIA